MKKIISIISLTFLSLFFIACDNKNEVKTQKKEEKQILKVGMELAYPPLEMRDKDGNPLGISLDYAKKLGEY